MKIIHSDLKHQEVKVKVENLDDLWYLNTIVEEGDTLEGQTVRKIKIGEQADQTPKIVKKTVFLRIKVTKVEFSKYTSTLRISGTVISGPEDIPHGSYHTFTIEDGTIMTITKENWLQYHLGRIKEAASQQTSKTLLCVFDREEAYFAVMKRYGYDVLSHIKGTVEKKAEKVSGVKNFYEEMLAMIEGYAKQYDLDHIIVASPSFWKEEFLRHVKNGEIRKKMVAATCSSCDTTAFNELLLRKEVEQALKQDRMTHEMKLVEELFSEIAKNNLGIYGMEEVREKAMMGAIKKLLITDTHIQKLREKEEYGKIEAILRAVENGRGEISLITGDHDGGKKLDGIGGIGGILRYKTEY